MKKRLLVLGILLLCFVSFTSFPVLAQDVATGDNAALPEALATGSGGLQKAIFLSETATVANGSIDVWTNSFSTSVTLGGTSPQCIEMRYSGEVKMTGLFPLKMQFRALVDGVLAKGGAPFVDLAHKDSYTTTAMNWWVCGLKAGTHNVKIQFGPFLTDETSYVRNRTLTIEYAQ